MSIQTLERKTFPQRALRIEPIVPVVGKVTLIGNGISKAFFDGRHPAREPGVHSFSEVVRRAGFLVEHLFDSTNQIEDHFFGYRTSRDVGSIIVVDNVGQTPYDFTGSMTASVPGLLKELHIDTANCVLAMFGNISNPQDYIAYGYKDVAQGDKSPLQTMSHAVHLLRQLVPTEA